MQSWFTFEIDGKTHRVDGAPAQCTLSAYLDRQDMSDGVLLLLDADGEGRSVWRSVDSATVLLPSMAGRRLLTVKGIQRAAATAEKDHPILQALAGRPQLDCSRSGRATVTAALFEGYYRADLPQADQFSEQLDNCLSRTADYAGIRETAREVFGTARRLRADALQRSKVQGLEKEFKRGQIDIFEDPFSGVLAERFPDLADFAYVDPKKHRFYRPQSLPDLLKLRSQYPDATIVGGGVEVAAALKVSSNVISTEGIASLRSVIDHGDHWEIGSAASLSVVFEMAGASYPALAKILRRFGSRPIRNRATLGGYLGSSRTDGELSPLLIALDAKALIISADGDREVSVASLFEGGTGANLRPGEIIGSVLIPRFTGEVLASRGCRVRLCDAYKAGPRRELFPAIIAGGFAVELDQAGNISQAWLVYSGLSERPIRARETERALSGHSWSEETIIGVLAKLAKEIEMPADGSRSSREYRRQLVITLFQKFYYQHARPDGTPMELGAVSDFLT